MEALFERPEEGELCSSANGRSHSFAYCLHLHNHHLHYFIPYRFGATASNRVSNELGAGNPQAAKMAVWATTVIAITEAIIISITLFFCRYILVYAFSSEKEIVNHVADMVPLILSVSYHGFLTISTFRQFSTFPRDLRFSKL
uniref:MATE efflux family protein n=1 Tax=Salix viminalis TaxID=40686 RepID=A0A6N2LRB1_SALVM